MLLEARSVPTVVMEPVVAVWRMVGPYRSQKLVSVDLATGFAYSPGSTMHACMSKMSDQEGKLNFQIALAPKVMGVRSKKKFW